MTELDDHFGEDVASQYDDSVPDKFAAEILGPTVDMLAGLVGDGAALEFAVGTGRVALPLADRGIPVSGFDLSTDRWAGWDKSAFTGDSTSHVSVWRKGDSRP
jgi:hypothetical protein